MSNLDECHRIASERQGKCLTKEYINQREIMKWQCSQKHQWYAPFRKVKHDKSWCLKCTIAERKISHHDAHELAEKLGGKCLSKTVKDSRAKLIWICKDGHKWKSSYWAVGQNRWCKECKKNEKKIKKSSERFVSIYLLKNEAS